MGLGSVLQTALSGLSAAESVVGAVAHNLANARTDGFKASKPVFATQRPRTVSQGAAATGGRGGTNPIQVGAGVGVAGISVDFSQGTIALDPSPTSVALEGEGLFILEGSDGERLFTRDGRFSLNAAGELIAASGHRVLGHTADKSFRLQSTQLAPLRIPPGLQAAGKNGRAAKLVSFSIQADGRIQGRFSDGIPRTLGQIRVARFHNPSGLVQRGENVFAEGPASGLPIESTPGEGGTAEVQSGAVELSNTDVAESLIDLSSAETQFLANLEVMETGIELLDELMSLNRPA